MPNGHSLGSVALIEVHHGFLQQQTSSLPLPIYTQAARLEFVVPVACWLGEWLMKMVTVMADNHTMKTVSLDGDSRLMVGHVRLIPNPNIFCIVASNSTGKFRKTTSKSIAAGAGRGAGATVTVIQEGTGTLHVRIVTEQHGYDYSKKFVIMLSGAIFLASLEKK